MSTIKLVLYANSNDILIDWSIDTRDNVRVLTYDALKENDPYFSNLFDSVLVVDDESEELLLSGSVAEAIREGWNDYLQLYIWMKDTGDPYITYDMTKTLSRPDGKLTNRLPPLVSYGRILLLSQILNMLEYWEMCTISRDNTHHLEMVGNQVIQKLGKYFPSESWRYYPQDGEVTAYLIAKVIEGTSMWMEVEKYKVALYGTLRMATLITRNTKIHLSDVYWKTSLDLLDKMEVQRNTSIYNTIAILAGKGNLNSTVNWPSWKTLLIRSDGKILKLPLAMEDVKRLYDSTLGTFPDNVHPLIFGLTVAVDGLGKITQGVNDLASIVPNRHNVILLAIEDYAEGIDWNIKNVDKKRMAAANSALLLGELGEEGARRILLSLLYYDEEGKANDTSRLYAEELEKALSGEGDAPIMMGGVTESNIVRALLYITQK